ncbi:FRG domain-containing protein [Paenibacillus sp. FSL L8-0340]|uniref:FRG domain-containing protein n=1 Tax=Paenibacillus sp. FSL L8-0340 TaxID=2954685 RepID=UPI00315860D5
MAYSKKWLDILDEVHDFRNQDASWFRGHSNLDYELNSGLFRLDFDSIEKYISAEAVLYRRFLNLGHLHHTESDWNLLYVMQHHGVITRLLDWSESFNTALFFAFINWNPSEVASIWMLHPTKLNYLSTGSYLYRLPREQHQTYEDTLLVKKGEFNHNSIALYPTRNSDRVVAQQGVFTLQGNSMVPLDQEFGGKLIDEGNLKRILLTPDLKLDVMKYLDISGVNYYTLFPDLDGLSKYINDAYIKKRKSPLNK